MAEKKGLIAMHGNPLTLTGREVKIGEKAPDFTVLNNDLQPVALADYRGKIVVLATVPSLDTAVCSVETQRFNREAARLGGQVAFLTVSADLPFAQKRWATENEINHIQTLSDHREMAVGEAYGMTIKELRLLARAVFVIDAGGTIQYIQLVNEVSDEPDYDAVLAAVEKLL